MNLPVLAALGATALLFLNRTATAAQNLRILLTGASIDTKAIRRGQAIVNINIEVTNPAQVAISVNNIVGTVTNERGATVATIDLPQGIGVEAGEKRNISVPVRLRADVLPSILSQGLKAINPLTVNAVLTTSVGQVTINQSVNVLESILPNSLALRTSNQ